MNGMPRCCTSSATGVTRRKSLAFAILAGGAAALGHAPFYLWPVALPGFAAVVFLVAREVAALERQGGLLKKVVRLVRPTVVHIDARRIYA